MVGNSTTQIYGFDQEEQGMSSSRTTDTPSQIPIPPDMEVGMEENTLESMLSIPDDFDWELFDTQVRPQVSSSQDAWRDLDTQFENEMDGSYNL